MEFCLVIDLTMDGDQVVIWPPIFAARCVSFCYCLVYQVANTCYPQKKLISNTGFSCRHSRERKTSSNRQINMVIKKRSH